MNTMTTADIAQALGLEREYVTDRVVKRPDFPAPVLILSRKTRRWARADVDAWREAQAIQAAGLSGRASPGSNGKAAT